MVLSFFNWDSDQVPFAVFGWKHSCLVSQNGARNSATCYLQMGTLGAPKRLSTKQALTRSIVKLHCALKPLKYLQTLNSIVSPPSLGHWTQATLLALAADSWPGPAATGNSKCSQFCHQDRLEAALTSTSQNRSPPCPLHSWKVSHNLSCGC